MNKQKPILQQKDRFGQLLTLHLRTDVSDQAFDLNRYLKALVETQSLESWNGRQAEFAEWIAGCVAEYTRRNLRVHIWGHSKPEVRTFDLYWSPEGKKIATVRAESIAEAKKQTPKPWRKYMGEVYAQEVQS